VDFSLIGWDPNLSLLLAGSAKPLVVDGKGPSLWGERLKTNFVDYSVEEILFVQF